MVGLHRTWAPSDTVMAHTVEPRMIPIESLRTLVFHYEWSDYSDPVLALKNYLNYHVADDRCWLLVPRQVLTFKLAQGLFLRGRYNDGMEWLARSTTGGQLKGWDNMVYLTSYYIDGEVVPPPASPTPCDNVHLCWRMYWLGRQGVWDYRQAWPEGAALLEA